MIVKHILKSSILLQVGHHLATVGPDFNDLLCSDVVKPRDISTRAETADSHEGQLVFLLGLILHRCPYRLDETIELALLEDSVVVSILNLKEFFLSQEPNPGKIFIILHALGPDQPAVTLLIRHLVKLHDLLFPIGLEGFFLFSSQRINTTFSQSYIGVAERRKPLSLERFRRKSNLGKYSGLASRHYLIVKIIHYEANFALSNSFCVAKRRWCFIEILCF